MASTIRHNRARGTGRCGSDEGNIVKNFMSLAIRRLDLKHLGMDRDEILRLKQITVLPRYSGYKIWRGVAPVEEETEK